MVDHSERQPTTPHPGSGPAANGIRPSEPSDSPPRRREPRPVSGLLVLLVGATIAALVGQQVFLLFVGNNPALQTWSTIFVAIVLQALPFLGLGVLASSAIAAFVPDRVLSAALPKKPAVAVPIASLCGVALPGCECGSVPFAKRMMARGVAPSAALSFMLASPAINPIVLVATAVAFPHQPRMVLDRFVASLLVAIIVGLLWDRLGRPDWLKPARSVHVEDASRMETFRATLQYDLLQSAGFLVVGAGFSATFNVLIDPRVSLALAGIPVVSVVLLGAMAVLLAVCSEADAFVANSFSGFSLTAKLAFMVVGPMVDVKLIAMQAGSFGRKFASRFAPVTFAVAILVTLVVGGFTL